MKSARKAIVFGLKLAVSLGLVAYVVNDIRREADWGKLVDHLASGGVPWLLLAFVLQAGAMTCTILRWKLLLDGQEMEVPLRHLVGAFLIGRMIGNFAPSTLGLDGYRMYDIARHSGKISPAVSVILVEKVIGFFVLSLLVLLTLPWGMGILPGSVLAALGVVFAVPVLLALVLLLKPSLIQRGLGFLFRPGTPIGKKIENATAAVTTYEAHRGKLFRAVLAGFPIHILNVFVFLCSALAIGAPVSVSDILFVGPLAISAGLVPISLAGLGVREKTFDWLLEQGAVPRGYGGLVALVGRLIGLLISLTGGLAVWLSRRAGYRVQITGRAMETKEEAVADGAGGTKSDAAARPLLGIGRHLWAGATAGVVAGMLVGMAEMTYILLRVPPPRPWGSLAYAALLYGAVCGSLGSLVAAAIWSLARWLGGKRHGFRASAEGLWAGILLLLLAGLGAVIVRFRVFRDLFDETLLPMSAGGLAIQLMILILSGSIFLAGWLGLRSVLRRPRLAWVLRPWGAPLVALALLAPGLLGHALSGTRGARAAPSAVVPPAGTPNVVFVMIDTLRVDEVGAYNPEAAGRRQTPALDAFADEGVVFDQAFANASWTRPSVASAFTGRFPSSHGAVAKDDALPDAAQTLAELLRAKGYRTAGVVTNYNLAPDFNFQQGFDEYVYLTPRYFLGADDTTAKLALYQIFRLVHERWSTGAHDVDRYYQDARRVTDESLAWLDRHSAAEPDAPFFLFVQYMDPHDPYFAHDGSGDVFGHAIDPSPPHGRRDRILEVYRQEVRFTDEHLGRLLAGLRDRGLLDPSVVLVWSDHGEEFLDHGDWWHGTSLYDELVHVPLVVRLPRAAPRAGWNRPAARPGSHVRGWVSIIDLPWTVLHEAGYAPEDLARLRYQGADLFLPRERPTVFMEENHQGNVLRALRWIGDGGESWKTIEAEQIARPGLRPVELYSVAPPARPAALTSAATARRERAEVSGAQAAVLADGRRRLREVAEAARSAALARQQASTNVDQARLEALGYVQKDTAPPPPGPDAGADDADARR